MLYLLPALGGADGYEQRAGPECPQCAGRLHSPHRLGRFREENGRKILGLSLEVNHRMIDGGISVALREELTRLIESLRSELVTDQEEEKT